MSNIYCTHMLGKRLQLLICFATVMMQVVWHCIMKMIQEKKNVIHMVIYRDGHVSLLMSFKRMVSKRAIAFLFCSLKAPNYLYLFERFGDSVQFMYPYLLPLVHKLFLTASIIVGHNSSLQIQ